MSQLNCNCREWHENITKVNAPVMLAYARSGGRVNYDGVLFRFCPWCSKPLNEAHALSSHVTKSVDASSFQKLSPCPLPIPKALYSCSICREDYSWPADDLFWPPKVRQWICRECYDEDGMGERGTSLEAEIRRQSGNRDINALVNRFLAWPLPESVCSDQCATERGYPHRSGTNLLTADEARQMLEYLLTPSVGAGTDSATASDNPKPAPSASVEHVEQEEEGTDWLATSRDWQPLEEKETDVNAGDAPKQKEHFLKCWPEFFNALRDGTKTFEVRRNDRGFQVGDTLDIHEFVPFDGGFTGRALTRRVTYLLEGSGTVASQFGVQAGYVVMGLAPSVVNGTENQPNASCVPKSCSFSLLYRRAGEEESFGRKRGVT